MTAGEHVSKVCTRKRKAHAKSRGGCQNCKIRRIKCDEARPLCSKCSAFGVSCTYDRTSSELQPFEEAAFSVYAPLNTRVSLNQTVLGMLNDHLRQHPAGDSVSRLDDIDLEALNTFHERTVLTLGDEATRHVYQREGVRLAIKHPFLLHTALTLTMMHSRSHDLSSKQSAREVFHWYRGTSQYSKKLADPNLTSSERDAIWMTAAMLGCTTLAHVDVADPEQSWPLRERSPTDLDWLKLSTGKKEAWAIADLSRPDSSLRHLFQNSAIDDFVIRTSDQEAFAALPAELVQMCNLDSSSTSERNPYHTAAASVGRLVPLKSCCENMLKYFTFLLLMTSEFQSLLDARDMRAVVIMLWYQSLLGDGDDIRWFFRKRTLVECESMIYYLERHYSHVPEMAKLLEFPKRVRFGKSGGSALKQWT